MGVTGGTRPQTVLRIAERIVGAADGFVTTGTAVINGVEVTPGAGPASSGTRRSTGSSARTPR